MENPRVILFLRPLTGAFEDLAIEEIKSQYETYLFGLIRTTQAVLPIMRKQKSGTIRDTIKQNTMNRNMGGSKDVVELKTNKYLL